MDSSKFETLEGTYINSCAVQTCKKLNEIIDQRCCGCKKTWNNQDCLMLTQDEKVDLYFEEALRCMNLSEVEKTAKDCVSALLPQTKEQIKFWNSIPKDPRKEKTWKTEIKKHVVDIMNFTWF